VTKPNPEKPRSYRPLFVFLFTSTTLNKAVMFYFGINYSNYPGHGYGYGLLASLSYLVCSAGYLIYKYRDLD
jgi:hypothetical protein